MTGRSVSSDDAAFSRLSAFCLRSAVVVALLGMMMGLAMGVHQDFRLATVHAHANLLGWVSFFLYGLFYRRPGPVRLGLARVQVALAAVGLIIFLPALALRVADARLLEPLAPLAHVGLALGPILMVVGMALFGFIVFHATRRR